MYAGVGEENYTKTDSQTEKNIKLPTVHRGYFATFLPFVIAVLKMLFEMRI